MNQKPPDEDPLGQLTLATFSPLMGTRFRVRFGDTSTIELELTEATPLPPARSRNSVESLPGNESFSLMFHGPGSQFLEQATYEIEHDQIKQFCLFLVPIGKNQQGYQYQAIFNRLG